MAGVTMRVLRPGDEAALEAFLLPRIESSMFLLGNMRMAGLVDNGRFLEGSYVAAFEDGQISGVVAHFWNGNLVLQAPVHLQKLWPVAVAASKHPIEGILGPAEQVGAVFQALAIRPADVQLDEPEKLYSLPLDELIEPSDLRAGKLRGRRIERRDLDLVTKWRVGYSLETLGETDTPQLYERCRASVERSLDQGRTWVLEDEGQPVACSSFNTATREAVQVGGVWTPPEWRRRGYGRSVVAASLQDARAEGAKTAILFTGIDNVPAQRAYEALGFRHIGDYRLLRFKSGKKPPGASVQRA